MPSATHFLSTPSMGRKSFRDERQPQIEKRTHVSDIFEVRWPWGQNPGLLALSYETLKSPSTLLGLFVQGAQRCLPCQAVPEVWALQR